MNEARLSFGEYRKTSAQDVPTFYLVWACGRGVLRKKYPDSIRLAIGELRRRAAEPGRLEADLLGDSPTAASDLI
jgi:hypothetical protein